MDLAALESEKSKLVKKIKKSGLPGSCMDLAMMGEYRESYPDDVSIDKHWRINCKNPSISVSYDSTINNGQALSVFWEGGEVFRTLNGEITRYIPGSWEPQVKDMLDQVRYYKENFPSLID